MSAISFTCEATLKGSATQIATQILDLSRWPQFAGYRVVPGIKAAAFEKRTDEIVGSRIRVTSTDGSSYIEEIAEWRPDSRVVIVMNEFAETGNVLGSPIEERTGMLRICKAAPRTPNLGR